MLHSFGWVCLSPRSKGGPARALQATFLSLTNEGGRRSLPVLSWVVTDTGFQLLTKTMGQASRHIAT